VAIDLTPYIGRTIDVLAFRGAQAAGETLLKQSLADSESTGEICTGVQKLAQRFLIALLTEKASAKYAAAEGTNLIRDLRQGRIRSEIDMRASFALAEQQARERLMNEEQETDPTDERYRKAELTTLTLSPGSANLTIALSSQSAAVTFVVPLAIVV